MELSFVNRLKHAWNAFANKDPTPRYGDYGYGTSYRPDRIRLSRGNERSIVTAVFNRIALDVSAMNIVHAQIDENDRYESTVNSGLNRCLTLEANTDQAWRAFIQDVVMSMFDEGCDAIVPVDIDDNIEENVMEHSDADNEENSFDILSMRVAKIVNWYPQHVKVRIYNEKTGLYQELVLPKKSVAIIENPFYAVVNEPNSTGQRLARKLAILDAIDEQSGSGKLDLIIQLPYSVRSDLKREQAKSRKKEIEEQLVNSKYGIAYIDSTEHVTQLNRSLDNNLLKQIEYLTNTFYSQLSITQSVMDGTADEKTMNNYYSRTIEVIISTIVDEMKRKFLSDYQRDELKQSILFFRDPFKLVPIADIANMADTFTRNEIFTSNEIRQFVGVKPSKDPKADELRNSNISKAKDEQSIDVNGNLINESDITENN